MKKLLIIKLGCLISLISGITFADDKLRFYKCENQNNCSGQCEYQNRDGIFLIDKKTSFVRMNAYEKGTFARSVLFENCKVIFNEKNWDCSNESKFSSGTLLNQILMIDGIYYTSLTVIKTGENGKLEFNKSMELCAK